jgi:hypothetical protein
MFLLTLRRFGRRKRYGGLDDFLNSLGTQFCPGLNRGLAFSSGERNKPRQSQDSTVLSSERLARKYTAAYNVGCSQSCFSLSIVEQPSATALAAAPFLIEHNIEFSCRSESDRYAPVQRTAFYLNRRHSGGQLQRLVTSPTDDGGAVSHCTKPRTASSPVSPVGPLGLTYRHCQSPLPVRPDSVQHPLSFTNARGPYPPQPRHQTHSGFGYQFRSPCYYA